MSKRSVAAILVLISALGCTDRPEVASPETMAEAARPFEGAGELLRLRLRALRVGLIRIPVRSSGFSKARTTVGCLQPLVEFSPI